MNPSDPIGRPRKTGALFARLLPVVFHKKDTIPLLRALLEFSSLKKKLVVYDRDDEYEFVRPRLECSPSKQQVKTKCVQLKKLYRSKLSEGAAAEGLTGDDAVIFELSEKLWGEEIMLELKEKERERSARAVRLGGLRAVLGLEDVRLMKDRSDEGGDDVRANSEGQSLGMVSGKGGKHKREDEPGKTGGMADNVSGDEVLDDVDGEIVGSDKSSAKSGSEDGESAREVSRKEKKHKGGENGKLAKAEDSRTSGLVNGSSASYGSRKEKKHKRRELDNFSENGSGIEDDGSARSPADSQLDNGEKSRKKKKHKGDEAGEFKRLSEGRNFLEKENNHKGDKKSQELGNLYEKGSASSQLEDGKSSKKKKKKKKKKHKGDRSYIRSRHQVVVPNGIV